MKVKCIYNDHETKCRHLAKAILCALQIPLLWIEKVFFLAIAFGPINNKWRRLEDVRLP